MVEDPRSPEDSVRSSKKKHWKTYEEVAAYLLEKIANKFGLTHFEGKQKVQGKRSGTEWEIDAKGVKDGTDIFFIVECRRYTKARQSQEKVGSLAYKIQDTGASGGIVVSPLGIQKGAKLIAEAERIHSVQISPSSTKENYVMRLLNEIHVGVTEHVCFRCSVSYTLRDKDGNIIRQGQNAE